MRANNITDPSSVRSGQWLFLPGAQGGQSWRRPVKRSKFIWPVRGSHRVTSRFGRRRHPIHRRYQMHEGVDIAGGMGAKTYASRAGRVSFAGWIRGYGRVIVIKHASGYSTRYGHLHRIKVRSGEWVEQGEVIGAVGKSGKVTGPHLHFEVRHFGRPVNPLKYLRR